MNRGGSGKLNVFEGMMNFLTAVKEDQVSLKDTNIVLNTLSLYQKAIAYARNNPQEEVNLFLDNGKGGDKFHCTISGRYSGCKRQTVSLFRLQRLPRKTDG